MKITKNWNKEIRKVMWKKKKKKKKKMSD